jgi:hypothetical protein
VRRVDLNRFSSRGVRPLPAFAAAGEHERIHLVVFDDAETQIAIVRRRGYRLPFVQGRARPSFATIGKRHGNPHVRSRIALNQWFRKIPADRSVSEMRMRKADPQPRSHVALRSPISALVAWRVLPIRPDFNRSVLFIAAFFVVAI